jgi:hypothetical protein
MPKVKIVPIGYKGEFQWHIMCLGCGYTHAMSPKIHQFNGDLDKPTFSPSLLQNFTPGKTCHSFVVDGNIQYLSDCDHHLAGKTVELPEFPG